MIAEAIPYTLDETGIATQHKLMSGDEAVALGALDAGIRYASAYPGTPATDIQEAISQHADEKDVRCIWSINEKVAYESALAVAIAGQRALVSMKQVGLNVAADAFINSCAAGCDGGLVLVVGDDPECHSSQNKQDTRHYRPIAGTLLLEPVDSQEAYAMTREAFRLSERFRLPVMLRLTTRTAYGCTPVRRSAPEAVRRAFQWPKDPKRFFIVPSNSRKLFLRIANLQQTFAETVLRNSFTRRRDASGKRGNRVGILCTGIGAAFAYEMAHETIGILKVAGDPFPEDELESFIDAHDRIVVAEEGDPILETRARARAPAHVRVEGRLSGHLKVVGELIPKELHALIYGEKVRQDTREVADLPPRLPEICKPCGYHKVFAALKEIPGMATPSDIGCNALGGLPPYSVMDGIWAMGSSIGVACGLAAIGHKRVLAIIGDSTFFHAGIPPLLEAVHEGHQMSVLVLDNGTTAMTGGQGVAHRAAARSIQKSVDLIRVIEALGVKSCTPFDPHKLGSIGIRALVENSFQEPGVKVLLYRSQCGIYSPGYFTEAPYAIAKGGTST